MSESAILHPSIVHHHEDHEDHGHVHFPEGLGRNAEIAVTHAPDNKTIHIHLGFLKINHKYQAECQVPGVLGDGSINTRPESPHLEILEIKHSKDEGNYDLTFELMTHKEGLQRDKFHMVNEDNKEIAVVIHSRVMGRHKGTPMLKESIKCIGVSTEDESEASDWQGFDKE